MEAKQGNLAQPNGFRRRGTPSNSSKLNRFHGVGRVEGFAVQEENPENPLKTWAGRRLQPRLSAAAIKSGKRLEDFTIAPVAKADQRQEIGLAVRHQESAQGAQEVEFGRTRSHGALRG
jgi:hypothetical protein